MFDALTKIIHLLDKRSKIQFSGLMILLIFKSILDGFGLGMIAPFIAAVTSPDVIFEHKLFVKINTYLEIQTNQELIVLMSVVLVGFFIMKNIFSLLVIYTQSRLIFTKRSAQGRKLFEAYLRAPYNYHLKHNTAELDRNIRYESTNAYSFIQSFLLLCSNILLTISIFIVLLIVNWEVVLSMGFLIISFSYLFLAISGKYSTQFGLEVQESQLHIGQAMKEGMASVVEVKLTHLEHFFPARYYNNMMNNARANWRQSTLGVAPTLFFEVLAVSLLAGVIIIFSYRKVDINALLPMFGLFSLAIIRLIPSVTVIIKSLQDIRFLTPSVNVVYAVFEYLNGVNGLSNGTHKQFSEDFKILSLNKVSFAFPGKKSVNIVNEISLNVMQGDVIGITGPSGSGKTSLINLILGLLQPDKGLISVNDKNIQHNIKSWHYFIGYVPQSITLIDASIKENIGLGLAADDIDEERVWSVLKETNMVEFVKTLPEKLDTFIGENGMRISGGQRQRLGLARALYRNPQVVIFDEATSALDVETEKRITKEIMNLSGKRTVIIVSHRISTIRDCDVIYYLKDGKIVNSGRYEELRELNADFNEISKEVENK